MATECRQDSFDFGTVAGRSVVGAFDGGVISSDAGALLLGATDKAIDSVNDSIDDPFEQWILLRYCIGEV